MNNTSQCVFDISHVIKNLRDTLEYVLPKEHDVKTYDQRKTILKSITDPKSFLGKFIQDNKEKLTDFKKKYDEFLDEIYGDNSTIITKTADDKIRVDHTQHQKIFDYVIYLSETLRDIMFSHASFARSKQLNEQVVDELVTADERFDRVIKSYLLIQEYQKSFMEFQKVMGESKGQPTPQSNYIVQNELVKIAQMIRFVRAHCHITDNKTLDLLDKNIQLVEMSEGRRDRRDNKNFPDLYKENLEGLSAYVNELAPVYDEKYQKGLKDMLDTIRVNAEKKPENPAA